MIQAKRRKRDRDDGDEAGQDGLARGNQTLPVAELPLNFDGIPLDGAQYLAVVRREAIAAPSVVYVARPVPTQHATPAGLVIQTQADQVDILPPQEWRDSFLNRFRNMRESLSNRPIPDGGAQIGLPGGTSARKWFRFIHGVDPFKPQERVAEDHSVAQAQSVCKDAKVIRTPNVSILQHFQTSQILALLAAFSVWLQEGWHAGPPPYDDAHVIQSSHSQWLFALLSHLEDRLVGEDISTLRDLARSCIDQIGQARQARGGQIDFGVESGAWIVVCAITGVWGQHDLWDDASARLRSVRSL